MRGAVCAISIIIEAWWEEIYRKICWHDNNLKILLFRGKKSKRKLRKIKPKNLTFCLSFSLFLSSNDVNDEYLMLMVES